VSSATIVAVGKVTACSFSPGTTAKRDLDNCVLIQPGSFPPPPSNAKNSAMCLCEIESLSANTSSTGLASSAISADQS
jgi:hypothetical protein